MRFLCFLLLLLLLPLSQLHSNPPLHPSQEGSKKWLDTARYYVGTLEKTNHNDGPVVEKFLASVGRHKGDSWCAAFVSYCLTAGKVISPSIRSGMAINFKVKQSIKANDVLIGKYKILPGTIVVWREGATVHGHTGFVESWNRQSGKTIEGNTSSSGSGSQSNGDGCYRKNRSIQPGNYFRLTCFTRVTE